MQTYLSFVYGFQLNSIKFWQNKIYIFNIVNNTHCFGIEFYSKEGKYALLSECKSEIIWTEVDINFYPRFILN